MPNFSSGLAGRAALLVQWLLQQYQFTGTEGLYLLFLTRICSVAASFPSEPPYWQSLAGSDSLSKLLLARLDAATGISIADLVFGPVFGFAQQCLSTCRRTSMGWLYTQAEEVLGAPGLAQL